MSAVRHAGYQSHLHKPDNLIEAAEWVKGGLARYAPTAQAIVTRGMSGVVVGSIVSTLTGLPLIIVRKQDDKHHGNNNVQGPHDFSGPYVIVDDFICSGVTARQILASCSDAGAGECVGIFLYSDAEFYYDGLMFDATVIPVYTHKFG